MITFQKIRFKNLLSFGNNYTTFMFDDNKSVLIRGKNGSGKSAYLLDSLCFVLYGKAFRKINKNELINYKNNSNLIAEIWFKTNENQYYIKRGLKPAIFEIYKNNKIINQNSNIKDYQDYLEKNILKIDYKSFNQIVILGKATYIAFLRLQLSERRNFIDNVLNLNVFSTMNELNKININILKDNIDNEKNKLNLYQKEIELLNKHILDFKNEQINQQKQHEQYINEQIKSYTDTIEIQEKDIIIKTNHKKNIDYDLDELRIKIQKLYDFQSKFEININEIQNKIYFFQNNSICPTCEIELNNNTKEEKIQSLINKKNIYNEKYDTLKETIQQTNIIIEKEKEKIKYNNNIDNSIQQLQISINHTKKLIIQLKNQKSFDNTSLLERIEENEKKLKIKKDEYDIIYKSYNISINELEHLKFLSNILKDTGIKSNIIKSYIPKIINTMNIYLQKLGLFVKFKLNSNFEEQLTARGVNDVTYMAFSEGEKIRLDLALMMTWRDICQFQNNMAVNFIIFDEILDASLDNIGTENVINLFNDLKNSGIKIITISPDNQKWADNFDETITIKKNEYGYSTIKGIN